MQAYKQNHLCQIDCTNHDQVINSLQIKSKDLYYFWRNYQWLYNKYYSQIEQPQSTTTKPQPQQPTHSYHEYEQEIKRLSNENRKFKIENESLKKQIQALSNNQGNNRAQLQFQRQIDRLNAKCSNYEGIRQKLGLQIQNLKRTIKANDEAKNDLQNKYKRQMSRQEGTIIQLQKSLDEQRAKIMQGSTNSDQFYQYQEKFRRETKKMQILMDKLQENSSEIIEAQLQTVRLQLLNQFPKMIAKFAEGDLNKLIKQQFEQFEEE